MSCDDNCEVWLSTSEDPTNIIKIASVGTFEDPSNTKIADFQAFPSQISKEVLLEKDKKYYIEVIHKQGAYKDHVLLTWLAPSWDRIHTITTKDISSFIDTGTKVKDVNEYKYLIPVTKACQGLEEMNFTNSVYHYNRTKHSFTRYDYREDFFKMQAVDKDDFILVLPRITYNPSYVLDFMPNRYEGVTLMHESSIYPDDNTELTHMKSYLNCRNQRATDSHFHHLEGFKPDEDEDNEDGEIENFVKEKSFSKYLDEQSEDVKKSMNMKLLKKNFIKGVKTRITSPLPSKPPGPVKFSKRKLLAFNDNFKLNSISNLEIKSVENNLKDDAVSNGLKNQKKIKYQTPTTPRPMLRGMSRYQSSRYDSQYGTRRLPGRFSNRKLRVYKNKVFFKNGKIDNFNVSKRIDGKSMMIHYHPLFGSAIYYLVTSVGRLSLWKYKTFLSKCKSEGNLPLYPAVN